VLLPWRRHRRDPLAGLKTLSYAANARGLEEARRRGADEGLWLNDRGHLVEGCASNLFVVRHARLYTPSPADGILAGVVREIVLDVARSVGLVVHEGRLRLRRLERADEAFLTSSVRGVRPLVALGGSPVGPGRPGPWTRRIREEVGRRRVAAPG
jgi:branched-subunit amino acid aminotransferase/4-amino-4-deoxychorismate lyase